MKQQTGRLKGGKNKRYEPSLQTKARLLFVKGLSLEKINHELDVPTSILRNWKTSAKKKGDDWAMAQKGFSLTQESLSFRLSEMLKRSILNKTLQQDSLEEEPSPALRIERFALFSDSISKMMPAFLKSSKAFSKHEHALYILQ